MSNLIDNFKMHSYDECDVVFKNKKKKRFIYVEGNEDISFFSNFLDEISSIPISMYGIESLGSRDEVILKCRTNQNKNNIFIIDRDYEKNIKSIPKNLLITTGYSMENFVFFNDNLKVLLNQLYSSSNKSNSVFLKLNKILREYSEYSLNYYAFMKTCVEKRSLFFHKVAHLVHNRIDYIKKIDDVIENMNNAEKTSYKVLYSQNVQQIKQSNLMLIRGHDIFDLLYTFLKNEKIVFNKRCIHELSKAFEIPGGFIEQYNNLF